MIKVAAHQPYFLPWVGYWNKVAMVDVMVHMPFVQVSGGDVHNRVKVNNQWVTLPVSGGDTLDTLKFRPAAMRRVARTLEQSLASKANPYGYRLTPLLEWMHGYVDEAGGCSLMDFNTSTIEMISELLGLHTSFESGKEATGKTTVERLNGMLVNSCGKDFEYYSGACGAYYLNEENFPQSVLMQKVVEKYEYASVLQLIAREKDPLKFILACATWS